MNEWPKVLEDLGVSSLMLAVFYKLSDKWLGRFLDSSNKQAEAMAIIAESVKTSAGESREILIAVRVQSSVLERLQKLIEEKL